MTTRKIVFLAALMGTAYLMSAGVSVRHIPHQCILAIIQECTGEEPAHDLIGP